MADDNPPSKRPPGQYASRPWPRPRGPRTAWRILGLPVLAVAGVYMFGALRDYIELPACDSDRARKSLAEVLKQLNFEPVRYEPLTTISTNKTEVVCNAVLPLPNGATVVVDYTFYWQGNKANMRYSISRRAA